MQTNGSYIRGPNENCGTGRCPSPWGGVSGGSGVAAVPESGRTRGIRSEDEEAVGRSRASAVCSLSKMQQDDGEWAQA